MFAGGLAERRRAPDFELHRTPRGRSTDRVMLLSMLLALGFLFVAFAPDTDAGRTLRRALVDAPARMLNGGPLRVISSLVVVVALIAILTAAPEMVVLTGMADVALYLDVVALALLVGALDRIKATAAAVIAVTRRVLDRVTGRVGPARSRSRGRKARKPRRPSNGDDAWPGFAYASALPA
jgi:hypothetical protein